jgi:hypothetical protein
MRIATARKTTFIAATVHANSTAEPRNTAKAAASRGIRTGNAAQNLNRPVDKR